MKALLALLLAAPVSAAELSPAEAERLIEKGRRDGSVVVLDVRTEEEYRAGHIPGSMLLDYHGPDFETRLAGLDKRKTYVVHCHSGVRSRRALGLMKRLGFGAVHDMPGGFSEWAASGLPVGRGSAKDADGRQKRR